MLENELCEEECYNLECNYDNQSCGEVCYEWMLGNGICEDQCNTAELNYDQWDCTCAPYCSPDKLLNSVCEPDCFTKRCDLNSMFDCIRKDEHCSYGCLLGYPYKTCQLECLTWECDYYNNKTCDERIKLHAFYSQIIKRDIDNPIDIYSTCLQDTSDNLKDDKTAYCTLEKLGDNHCHPECNTEDCAYDFGDCHSHCDSSCELCYEDQNDRACLKCKDGLYLLYTACFIECPYGFVPDIRNGMKVCVLSSIYTRFSEQTLFVSQDASIPYELQDGQNEAPFSSLTDAFAHIRANSVTIILLNFDNSNHFLKPVNMNEFAAAQILKRDDRPLDFGGLVILKNLLIIGHRCDNFINKNCYENNAVIQWSGLKPIQLDVSSSLYISNVDFYGYNPIRVEPCILEEYMEYCTYCQNTEFDYDTFSSFDDHGQEITWDYADTSDCERYAYSTLFKVYSTGQLEIYDSKISYWRAGFSSLIQNNSGIIKLDRVEFYNIILSSDFPSAVILSECNDNSYKCGEIYINESEVSLLNNGYEYNPKRYFSGFIYAKGVYQFKLENSRFSFNLAYRGYDTLLDAPGLGSLIYIENFLKVYISENEFTNNISEYLINLNMHTIYSYEFDTKLREYPPNINHVTLYHLNFTDNYSALIAANLEYELPNFKIERLTSTGNVSTRELISIHLNAYRNIWLNNSVRNTQSSNKSHGYTVIKRSAIISNISIIYTFSPSYLLSFINIGNLIIQSLSINYSIQHSDPSYSYINSIYSHFRENPNSYIDQDYQYEDLSFVSSVAKACYMRGISRTTLQKIEVIDNFSETGTDIEIYSPLVSLVVSGIDIERNLGNREKAVLGLSIVEFDIEVDINLVNGIENRNTNINSYGVIYLSSSNSCLNCNVKIKNSTFNKNSSGFGAAISTFIRSLYIEAVVFTDNSIESGYGGSLYLNTRGLSDYSIEITNTSFDKNVVSSGKGGAIAIDNSRNTAGPLNLVISNSNFTSNISSEESSILYISPSVRLSSTSTISNCSFKSNISSKGNIYLKYYLGVLTFQDCIFEENYGSLGIAICYDMDHFNMNSGACANLVLNRCLFQNNTSSDPNGSVIHMPGLSADFMLLTSECTFMYNEGSSVHLEYGEWEDNGSIFNNNYADGASVLQISSGAQAILTKTAILNNLSYFSGAFDLSGSATLIIKDSEITNNQSNLNGGVIFMEQRSIITIENCSISQNSAEKKGSVIYSIGCDRPGSAIISSKIYSNLSKDGGSIYLLSSYLNITSTEIYSNTDYFTSPGIVLNLSVLKLCNSTIYNQSGISGTGIYAMADSKILIQDCNLRSLHAQISGGVIYSFSSYINIQNSSIDNISSLSGGAILAYSNTVLEISDTEFYNSRADQDGGVILAFSSEAMISACTFTEFEQSAIEGTSLKSLIVLESIFRKGTGTLGGSIFCDTCQHIRVQNSIFEQVTADIGAAIYANKDKNAAISSYFEVESSRFIQNSAEIGGAIFVDNLNFTAFNTSFELNSAYSPDNISGGVGGALSLQCSDFNDCAFNLTNNHFINNHAARNGGAIWWRHSMPETLNNEFLDNTGLCGKDISTYPSSINLLSPSEDYPISTQSDSLPFYKSEFVLGHINNLVPGQPGVPIIIGMTDPYNNTVSTDSNSIGELYSYDPNTVISGKTKLVANQGVFEFLDYTISAKPGTEVGIAFETNAIQYDNFKNSDMFILNYGVIYIQLRNCTKGEKTTEDKCIKCPENTYSIDPSDIECKECPQHARCYGESYIVPKAGYWRSGVDSDRIFKCLLKEACLGSREFPLLDLTGRCREGYEGNLCHGCSNGYSRSTKNTCSKCPEENVNIVRLIFTGIGLILVVGWMVRATMKSAYKPKSIHSIYLKIFINYLQPISIVAGFDLKWPEYVIGFLRHQEDAGTMSEQILSLDCLLYQEDYLMKHEDLYFFKLTMMMALPLVMSCFAFTFWCIVAIYFRKWRYIKNEMISTIIILQFLVHPNLVNSMFGAFNCIELEEGEYWLVSNLEIACWSRTHLYYSTRVALPGIMIWGILIPGICLILLLKLRKRIKDVDFKLKFGFLYNGYSSKYCHWEFVIMYRKIIMIFMSVFLGSISVLIQALSVILVLVVAFYLQTKHNPYGHLELNRMEQRSILVAGVTIYCGLYYLSNHIEEEVGYLLFSIILAVNAYFLVLLGIKLIGSGLAYIIKRLPYLRKKFGYNKEQEIVESLVFLPNTTNLKTSQVSKNYVMKDSDELSETYLAPSDLNPTQFNTSKDLYMFIVSKKNSYQDDDRIIMI